jgi:hypothetical protein
VTVASGGSSLSSPLRTPPAGTQLEGILGGPVGVALLEQLEGQCRQPPQTLGSLVDSDPGAVARAADSVATMSLRRVRCARRAPCRHPHQPLARRCQRQPDVGLPDVGDALLDRGGNSRALWPAAGGQGRLGRPAVVAQQHPEGGLFLRGALQGLLEGVRRWPVPLGRPVDRHRPSARGTSLPRLGLGTVPRATFPVAPTGPSRRPGLGGRQPSRLGTAGRELPKDRG